MEVFEVILYKKTAQCSKKERCTVIGGAGGSRTHAPLTRPKAFRVRYNMDLPLFLFILLCVTPFVFFFYTCF